MQTDNATPHGLQPRDLMDLVIRIGIVAVLVVSCVLVFAPFAALMIWALILAVALYPLHMRLARRLGGRQGRAATLLVVTGLLVVGTPTIMLGSSFASQLKELHTAIENNTLSVPAPEPSVAEWPVIGSKIYDAWSAAATDLPAYMEEIGPQLSALSKKVLSLVANSAGAVLQFLASLIIAGIMMAYGKAGAQAMLDIFSRVAGAARGPGLQALSTATVRSVATGVIGVAFIQALLLGVGFILADIPAAGVLALIALLLGIAQVPAALVSLPVIAYLWSGDASTISNIIYTVYLLAATLADNVLKPLLLGRGVDAPMPVILLGALGGMVTSGMIGLFIGAVLLAVGYQLFMEWVAQGKPEATTQAAAEGAPAGE